jgi:hypothetical protein
MLRPNSSSSGVQCVLKESAVLSSSVLDVFRCLVQVILCHAFCVYPRVYFTCIMHQVILVFYTVVLYSISAFLLLYLCGYSRLLNMFPSFSLVLYLLFLVLLVSVYSSLYTVQYDAKI